MNLSPNPVISLETLFHKHSMLIIRKLIFSGFWRRKPQNLQQILQIQGCNSHSKCDTCCHGSLCYKASVGNARDMSTVFICTIITHSVYFHLMWRKHQKTSLTKHIHSLLNWLKVCGLQLMLPSMGPLILPHVLLLDCPCSLAPSVLVPVSKLFTVETIFS